LKQHEAGVSVAELAREHGVSTALIYQWRGKPSALRCDNGPEYLSQTLVNWANQHQITLLYIQPGKPTQNAYIERFSLTARREWLDIISLKVLPMLSFWPPSGFGYTITNGLIQLSVAYRPGS